MNLFNLRFYVKTDGEIGKMNIEGGKYVVAGFELTSHEFPLAWEFVMNWVPSGGLEPYCFYSPKSNCNVRGMLHNEFG